MLVARDIYAFCNQDWHTVATDFIPENFMGIDAGGSSNPDSWKMKFHELESYKSTWLEQAAIFSSKDWAEGAEKAFNDLTTLRDIEIEGTSAIAHKKFDGYIKKKDGSQEYLNWQTVYRCKKVEDQWKIAGFTGYLPNPMGTVHTKPVIGKRIPDGASQHKTAGPYSPVLEISPGKLVVISGQASISPDLKVFGQKIEEQTEQTLENCRQQLNSAGCTLNDVFKVNVFLTDLDNWPKFNDVYTTYFEDPKPVRTAVQTPLLFTLLVEIEMWAVKN